MVKLRCIVVAGESPLLGFDMRVLILACSARKSAAESLIPAIERYDGPSFRILRKFLRTSTEEVGIWILSAEFGLIPSRKPIPWYDRRMTTSRARELREPTVKRLQEVVIQTAPSELYVVVGKTYLEAIKGFESEMPNSFRIGIAAGGLGRKLSQLHEWLYANTLQGGPC